MASPKIVSPVSPSIAIELTSNAIHGFINDGSNKIIKAEKITEVIDFKKIENFRAFVRRLQDLQISDEIKERRDTYWTIGIPDNSSQKTRKAIIKAVENFRKPPPPIRLINRSTAGAISYLQSLRDQERLNSSSESDVEPYLPNRHFLIIFVENRQVYGADFKTVDGVVQQIKSYVFDDKDFEIQIENIEKADNPETRFSNLTNLWTTIVNDGINPKNKYEYTKIPVVFTYNLTSFLINDGRLNKIPLDFVYSPEDMFSLFPSINEKQQQWPDTTLFILKGINVKTRMLAGDADMIDYDVSSGFVGEAIIECKSKFKASLIRDGEKLPIHRTVFKAKEPIKFQIDYDYFGSYKSRQNEFICKVDDNGIIINIDSDRLISAAKEDL